MLSEEGNVHLDHALNITFPSLSPSAERTFERALHSIQKSCREISRSFTIVGYAAAAYLFMAGISRLMDARRHYKHLPPPPHHLGHPPPHPPPPPPHHHLPQHPPPPPRHAVSSSHDQEE